MLPILSKADAEKKIQDAIQKTSLKKMDSYERERFEKIRNALSTQNPDVNAYIDSKTALSYTLSDNFSELLQSLLMHPDIDVNSSTATYYDDLDDGRSPLLLSAVTTHKCGSQIFEILLNDPRIDVNAKNKRGETVLSRKEHRGSLTPVAVKAILDHPNFILNFDEIKNVLSTAIKEYGADIVSVILDHPRFTLDPVDIVCTAFSIDAKQTYSGGGGGSSDAPVAASCETTYIGDDSMNNFLFHPRIHQAFQHFSKEEIKRIWLAATENRYRAPSCFPPKSIIYAVLRPLFKKDSHFTFEEAKALLPGFSDYLYNEHRELIPYWQLKNKTFDENAYFEAQRNIATYPDCFFFYFGLHILTTYDFKDFNQPAIPVLDGESEQDHFIRCTTTVFEDPLNHALLALVGNQTRYQKLLTLFELLLGSDKIDIPQSCMLLIAAERCFSDPELFLKLFMHPQANINVREKDTQTPLHILLDQMEKKARYNSKVRQFFEKNAHVLFNDPRIDYTFWDKALFMGALKTDNIIIFKLVLEHFRQSHKLEGYNLSDPATDPKAFASHPLMKQSPQITASFSFESILKNDPNLTCEAVFAALTAQAFPGHKTWTEEIKQAAFDQARYALGLFPEHLFALTVFLCDGLLKLKQNTNDLDIDAVVAKVANKPQRFFTMAGKLPLDLQMKLCNVVACKTKEGILKKDSELAFKDLASKCQNRF